MLVRLTNICSLLLVLYAHFCICNFNQKNIKKEINNNFPDCFCDCFVSRKWASSTVLSPALCQIKLNYVCLFIYLALIYFHPT